MGLLICQAGDPAHTTPKIFHNDTGFAPWGDRHVQDLSAADVVSILEYCQAEGWRQGWNDSLNRRVRRDEATPFHASLLGRFPAREWTQGYRRSVDDQTLEYARNHGSNHDGA